MSQLVVPDVPVPDEAADQVAECGDPIRRLTPIRTRSKGSIPELEQIGTLTLNRGTCVPVGST